MSIYGNQYLDSYLHNIQRYIKKPIYYYNDIHSDFKLNNLINFYIKQKNKKKYYELSKKYKLISYFNKFI